MTTYAGEVRIKTAIDASGINAGVKNVTASLKKFAASANKLLGAIGVTVSIAALAKLGQAGVQAAMQLEQAQKGLQFLTNATGRSFQTANKFLQSFISDGLVPATDAYEAYKNMVARGYDTAQIEKMLDVMKDSAVYARQSGFTIGEAIVKSTQGLRMENSILTDSVGIQKNVAKMWDEYAKSIGTTANKLTEAQKRQAEFNGFMAEGGVYAGAAAQYTNTYAGRVAQLGAKFTELKTAIGNAIIPILNAIIPYVIRVIEWFTRLFNVIARVINLLFGTNVGMSEIGNQAAPIDDAAGAMGDLADNTEAAGEAAKGALAPFDKLNVLAQKTGGGGGGGGGGGWGGGEIPTFELPDETIFDDILDSLSAGWRSFIDGLVLAFREGDWSGLANWFHDYVWVPITDGAARMLNKIGEWFANTWEDIKTKTLEIWQTLKYNAINNIINPIKETFSQMWDDIVAWALKAWDDIKNTWQTVSNWFKTKVIDPVANWFKTAWENIKNWAITAWENIKNVWNTASTWFKNNVTDPIKNWFETAWENIKNFASNAWSNIQNIWIVVSTWFNNNVIKPLTTFFTDLWNGIKQWASDAWVNIQQTWLVVKDWFNNNVIIPVSNFFSGLWGNISQWASDAWANIQATWMVVSTWFNANVITPISNFFSTAWQNISQWASDAWNNIKTTWQSASSWFNTNVLTPIKNFFTENWDAIKAKVTQTWTDIKNAWQVASTWFNTNVLTPIKNYFTEKWESIRLNVTGVWANIKTAWQPASTWFQNSVLTPIKTFFTDKWELIRLTVTGAWASIKTAWQPAKDWFRNTVLTPIETAFTTIFTNIKTKVLEIFTQIKNGIIDRINEMFGWINNLIQKILGIPNIPTIPGGGGGSGGGSGPIPKPTQPPLMATGGVIPANAPFAAVLGDQRYGRNLEAPEGLIRQIVREETGKLQTQVSVRFEGDLGALVRELKPRIDAETKRVGRSLVIGTT